MVSQFPRNFPAISSVVSLTDIAEKGDKQISFSHEKNPNIENAKLYFIDVIKHIVEMQNEIRK